MIREEWQKFGVITFFIGLFALMIIPIYLTHNRESEFRILSDEINFWVANTETIPPPGTVLFVYDEQYPVTIQWDNLELGWFTINTEGYKEIIFPVQAERDKKTKTRFAGKMASGDQK